VPQEPGVLGSGRTRWAWEATGFAPGSWGERWGYLDPREITMDTRSIAILALVIAAIVLLLILL
jgi:hypothetical protein